MKTIGITGGVGAGKSTVLGFLETDFRTRWRISFRSLERSAMRKL